MSYAIRFEKHKDYMRFNLSNVNVEANQQGDFVIDFYEDIEQPLDGIFYSDEGELETIGPDVNMIRTTYMSATLPAYRIPIIIAALQEKLDQYNRYLQSVNVAKEEGNEDA